MTGGMVQQTTDTHSSQEAQESDLMASWSCTEVPHCAVRSITNRTAEGRWFRQARVRRSIALRSDRGRSRSPGVSVTCIHAQHATSVCVCCSPAQCTGKQEWDMKTLSHSVDCLLTVLPGHCSTTRKGLYGSRRHDWSLCKHKQPSGICLPCMELAMMHHLCLRAVMHNDVICSAVAVVTGLLQQQPRYLTPFTSASSACCYTCTSDR